MNTKQKKEIKIPEGPKINEIKKPPLTEEILPPDHPDKPFMPKRAPGDIKPVQAPVIRAPGKEQRDKKKRILEKEEKNE